MEAVLETISEGGWNSFHGMCSEEADFMAPPFGNLSIPNEAPSGSSLTVFSNFWPAQESNVSVGGVEYESAMHSLFPSSSHESYYNPGVSSQQNFVTNKNVMTMDYYTMESKNNNVMEADDFLNQDISNDSLLSDEKLPAEDVFQRKDLQLGRDHEELIPEDSKVISRPPEISKKRPRVPGEVQWGKRSMKLKKCVKVDDSDEENSDENKKPVRIRRQCSSVCSSEDDSNALHDAEGVASSSNSKGSALNLSGSWTRASRGSVTDPQSLYARKRRERINERLRILQSLVPNGTKADISTMLEEAVQYVKFLQLQIKLLSSDDHWMYAPIAYNGMNIGLDLHIPTPKPRS